MKVNAPNPLALVKLSTSLDGHVYFHDPPPTGYGMTVTPCNRPPNLPPAVPVPATCPYGPTPPTFRINSTIGGIGYTDTFFNTMICQWIAHFFTGTANYAIVLSLATIPVTAWHLAIANANPPFDSYDVFRYEDSTPEGKYPDAGPISTIAIIAQ